MRGGGGLEALDEEGVGAVEGGGVEGAQVDEGRGFVVVAESFAYDAQGYAFGFGR